MRRHAARDEECLEKRIYYRIISGKLKSQRTGHLRLMVYIQVFMPLSAYTSAMNTWTKTLENGYVLGS